MTEVSLQVLVAGRVQGVGFRYWVRSAASELGLRGSATNLADGRVAVVVEGTRDACEALLAAFGSDRSPGWVGQIVHSWGTAGHEPAGFRVR